MKISGVHVAVTMSWIEDALAVRIERDGMKISDLFLITHSPTETKEGESFLETPYGKLRVFWRNDMPKDKLAQILHVSKFEYPRKGNALSEKNIANFTTNVAHTKIETTKAAAQVKAVRNEFDDEARVDAARVIDELNRTNWSAEGNIDTHGDLVH